MVGGIIQAIGWAFLPILAWPILHLIFGAHPLVKNLSRTLISLIDDVIFFVAETTKWLLPLLVLSVAASVFALSIFGVTTTKWLESSRYIQAIVIMLGGAGALLASQHVRVDIFHTQMTANGKARVELFGYYLLMAPVCILLIWNSQSFVNFAWAIKEGSSEADGIRGVYWLKTLIPIFAIFMLAQGLSIATRAAMCLRVQDRPATPMGIKPFFESSTEDRS